MPEGKTPDGPQPDHSPDERVPDLPTPVGGSLMKKFMQQLFHRHDWVVVSYLGNLWTECASCGQRNLLPFDAVSEMPPGYPIQSRDPGPDGP